MCRNSFRTKMDEQKPDREDNALAKASSPPKTPQARAPTPSTTTARQSSSTTALASVAEKKNKTKQIKQKEMQLYSEKVVAIESNSESNWALAIE